MRTICTLNSVLDGLSTYTVAILCRQKEFEPAQIPQYASIDVSRRVRRDSVMLKVLTVQGFICLAVTRG